MLKIQDRQTKHNRFLDHDHDHHIILMSGGGGQIKKQKKKGKDKQLFIIHYISCWFVMHCKLLIFCKQIEQ